MYTLDTNILIYYSLEETKSVNFIDTHDVTFYISTISIIEYLSYPKISAAEKKILFSLVNRLNIINVDSKLAMLSAEIKKDYNLKLGDSIIAATAISTDSTLITRNISDFKKVKKLKLLEL